MITQIIFFLSLVGFIFLLARRYSGKNTYVTKATLGVKSGAGWLTKSLVMSLAKIRVPKPAFPRMSSKFGGKKAASGLGLGETDHDFWKEESAADKRELASHFEEGEELFKKGRLKDAEQFFLKAAANNPSDAKIYARLGLLYLGQKSYSDAIESLKMAVKLEKYNPSRHYNLALAYWGNKDTRRAIASVREAISLDPITQKYRKLLEELLNG